MAQPPAPELSELLLPDQARPALEQPWPGLRQEQHVSAEDKMKGCNFGVFLHKEIDCNHDYYHRMSKPWNYCQNGGSWEQKDIILN